MRILHVFSNYKWTGPAEPAVNLAAALMDRGHEVLFAAADVPPSEGSTRRVNQHAAERGLEVVGGLRLSKHLDVRGNLRDAAALCDIIRDRRIQVVHAHMTNDHLVASLAARKLDRPPKIARTFYDGRPPRGLRAAWLLSHLDAALFCSRRVLEAASRRLDRAACHFVEGAVDTARFDRARPLPAVRAKLGLGPGDYVVGIVARIQKHRRFDLLLDATRRSARELPGFRLVLIGRGSPAEEETLWRGIGRGLRGVVKLAGYVMGDDYVATLAALDAKIYLVPGSDGSCRAVREAMAMGLPVIASDLGMLPEIVEDGITGRVVKPTAEALAEAIVALGRPSVRAAMSAAALQRARRDFDLRRQAEAVERIYEGILRAQEQHR